MLYKKINFKKNVINILNFQMAKHIFEIENFFVFRFIPGIAHYVYQGKYYRQIFLHFTHG